MKDVIDEILETHSLGERLQIEFILHAVDRGTHTLLSLQEACYARSYGFRESFHALVRLLIATKYISIKKDHIQLGQALSLELRENFTQNFCRRLFVTLANSGVFHELFNNETISVDTSNRVIFFRNNRAPLKYAAVRNLLINIGLMSRDFGMQNVFVLRDEHYDWFLAGLIEWTSDSQIARGRSLADLKKRLERQAQAGLIGEEYVLGYEKSRLAKHRSVDSVSMISDRNVGAGYDILSFNDEASVIFDRFIEVKSYIGEPSFFWSTNEIKIAKEKGNLYFLCLVNLNEINLPEYQPIFIQNPAKSMFNDESWVHHCENIHFFRK